MAITISDVPTMTWGENAETALFTLAVMTCRADGRSVQAGLAAPMGELEIVSASDRVIEQLAVTGDTDIFGSDDICPTDEWVGATLGRAHADAKTWVERVA